MAPGNTHKRPAPEKGPISLETLASLAAASRGAPTGRVRSLEEARRTLRIPNSAETEVLQLWGTPKDFQLVIYPVAEADSPDLVAEFALLRVVKRKGSELVAGDKRTGLRIGEKSNALWIVYGSIAIATDRSLVIESIAIGPAFEGQLSRKGDDIAHGVTSQFLRLLSPQQILAACAEQLLAQGYWLDEAARRGAEPMSANQRAHLDRIDNGRPRHARISDDHLADLAIRYLTLYHRGNQRPRDQLAREFGISTTQVRDHLHQARQRGYLTPGTRGRAGASPGPRLLERGWEPAQRNPSTVVNIANSHDRPPKRRRPKHA
jgi:hypothetical protein